MMKEIKRPFHAQKALRVACLVLADLILINLSAFLALYIRFEFDFRQLYATTFLRDILIYAGINSACTILIFHILKLYNSLWEFAGVSELVRITLGCFFSAVFYMVGMFMLHLTVPRSFPAIYMLILCLLCGALRLSYRCVRRTRAGLRSEGEKRTMLIGGGQAGAIALREFQTSPRSENKVVCIIDDSPNKVGSYLRGVFTTDKNGEIIIDDLRIGEYVVSEVSDGASSAYVLPADKTASVFEGAVTKVEMHNELRDTPKTGDDSNPALWLALLGISAAGAAALGVAGFRKRRKEGTE